MRNAKTLAPEPASARSPWPLRTLALGAGLLALQSPGFAGQVPVACQFAAVNLPEFFRDLAAFSLLGFVIERQLGPRFWAACGWAFIGTGLIVQALFPHSGGLGLAGPVNALLFIALWETWRRGGGLLLPAMIFAGSLGVALLALPGLFQPQNAWCLVPAAGYAAGALWAVFHACRDTLRELGLVTRLSWKMY